MTSFTTLQNGALLILRLIIAAIFLYAGILKWMMPMPEGTPQAMVLLMQFLGIVEPLGGIALILGILTRWASWGLVAIMIGAIRFAKFMMGVGFFTPQGPGWAWPLMVLGGCLVLTAFGAGKWSVDAMQKRA